jgi:tryptophan synthase alpha chain
MPLANCTIVVERLGDNHYRASCPLFPDCQAVAATEAAASQAVAEAIQRILQERGHLGNAPPEPELDNEDRSSMNLIDALFQKLRAEGRKAFIPFVTAGDPDLGASARLLEELARRGASLIEIGFPYSDPIADGPVVQASYTRALKKGVRIDSVFGCIRELVGRMPVGEQKTPLVAMISYTLVHRRGPEAFLAEAQTAGLSGVIVPDLPLEESGELSRLAAARQLKLIQLVTPTTPRDRAVRIARSSTGFLYCVSVAGITGERDRLPDELLDQLRWLRGQTDLPICVGFGISKPEHVQMLRDVADGIIVGSALVRPLERAGTRPVNDIIREIGDLAQSLADALDP